MKKKKKELFHVIILILCMMIGLTCHSQSVKAADDGSAVEQAKKNVFRVEVSLTAGDKTKPRMVRSGTCFVVGNQEKDQKQYIITAKTNLDVSKKSIDKYRKASKLEKNDSVQTVYEIVISKDIRRVASVYDQAQDSNYAILQIDETIMGCTGFKFSNLDKVKDKAAVFSLIYDSDLCQVNLESAHLEKKDEGHIYFQDGKNNGYGAPLIDESGSLLGMKIPPETKDGELAEGLSVNILQHAFDTLGLDYEKSESKITILEKKIKEAKSAVASGEYTKKTCKALQESLDQAQSVYDNVKSTDKDFELQAEQLETGMKQLKPLKNIYRLVLIILGGVLLLVLLIILIVCLRARKREKALSYRTEGQAKGRKRKEAQKASETIDYDATVAVSSRIPTAYLIHKKSGTRLLVAKDCFTIGSKTEGMDYRISGNPAVSRKHAAIVNENGIFFLKDLGSTNHSYVNDMQLSPGEKNVLRNQDLIRLANEEFIFELR